MKGFKKLALASAVAVLPASGFAMEALEDEALSAVTGQDGVTISIASTTISAVRIDDSDAFSSSSATDGAIYISGISTGAGATSIDLDADQDTIQAAINLGAGTIDLGEISATDSGATTAGSTLIDMGSLTHTGIDINVQLGAEDQGHMAILSGTVTGGLSIAGFSIADGSSGEDISFNLDIVDAGGTDLTLAGNVNVEAGGLTIGGVTGGAGWDVTLGSLTLGSAAAIGDVSIIGLQLGTITISGH